MTTLPDRMMAASAILAPYAVPHGGKLGRVEPEPEDDTRFPFQRDRDRIIHTQAFRRLQGKTQVFVTGEEGDHVRTRLTHTMEVAQIARDAARTLGLNEDLAECIALAHDLGHPPFGHRGEEALHTWSSAHGLSFEHNRQSLRVVTLLERHSPLQKGLNVNREILEGLQKHREAWADEPIPRALTLEAQVVDLADEIAYLGHDADDGLRSHLFSGKDVASVPLAGEAATRAAKRGTPLRGALIHLLVTDLYAATAGRLEAAGIRSLEDVERSAERLVDFSPAMREHAKELRTFLWRRMYDHPRVTRPAEEGQAIILALGDRYLAQPTDKVLALQTLTEGSLAEAVRDYIAGMTDAYAKERMKK